MRKMLTAAGAVAALALSNPANAAVTVGSGDVGTSYDVSMLGLVNGNTETGISSLLTLTLTSITNGGATYNFGYSLLNSSTLDSRLRSFGFDVDPNLLSATATGDYDNVGYGENFPQVGTLDVCFRADGGHVCTGGPNGIESGDTGSGTLSLSFSTVQSSLTLDNFTTRYQSIEGSRFGTSGVGIEVPAVPEPATWALMLLGFFGMGAVVRRGSASEVRIRYA